MGLLACYIKQRRMLSDRTARQQNRAESVLVSDLSDPARRQTLSQVFSQYCKNQDLILYSPKPSVFTWFSLLANMNLLLFGFDVFLI